MNVKVFILIFFLIDLLNAKKKDAAEKCDTCDSLISNFAKGLKKTQKGNFGGGNTDWEDRKLGNYLTSETRFEEIIETVCSDSDCHNLLESIEEELLRWFKKRQNLENFESKLKEKICIKDLKYCCPEGKFGPDCAECPKSSAGQICSGNGKCQGEGKRSNRERDGKCDCYSGYTGDLCQDCQTNFYYAEYKNDSHTKCSACHQSCQECSGPDANSCQSCRDGWKMNEGSNVCEDINECLVRENACSGNQFCENNEGSYVCHDCDRSCSGCTGSGNQKCLECGPGYKSSSILSRVCEDINECEETPDICGANKKCFNKPGSFECKDDNSNSYSNESNRSITTNSLDDQEDLEDNDENIDHQMKTEL